MAEAHNNQVLSLVMLFFTQVNSVMKLNSESSPLRLFLSLQFSVTFKSGPYYYHISKLKYQKVSKRKIKCHYHVCNAFKI